MGLNQALRFVGLDLGRSFSDDSGRYDCCGLRVMSWLFVGPTGVYLFWISFAPVFSFIYC